MGFLPQETLDRLHGISEEGLAPKRGDAIFDGVDYPREWAGFIGQEHAKEQLQVAIASAVQRDAPLDHVLLESGMHGIGKTTLAYLLASQMQVGILATTGPLSVDEARALMLTMRDRDILFIDEAHKLVDGGRTKADWILPFMLEGKLYTARGPEVMPAITIVAATTEAGRLPETILSRFMKRPALGPYSNVEATDIVGNLAARMGIEVAAEHWPSVARAANKNPRAMRKILTQIRDLNHAFPDTAPNLDKALEYAGLSADGLTLNARHMLIILATSSKGRMSIDDIGQMMNEPGSLRHDEQALKQRGLIEVTGQGRQITDAGLRRAQRERS